MLPNGSIAIITHLHVIPCRCRVALFDTSKLYIGESAKNVNTFLTFFALFLTFFVCFIILSLKKAL